VVVGSSTKQLFQEFCCAIPVYTFASPPVYVPQKPLRAPSPMKNSKDVQPARAAQMSPHSWIVRELSTGDHCLPAPSRL
jgi:hypothetical protein